MNKKIQNWIASLIFVVSLGIVATPQAVFAAPVPPSGGCTDTLLTFPAWYKGLQDGNCDIKSPTDAGGLPTFIWTIALNVIEVMLQLVGYLAVGFIIRGGFKYMTSVGDAGETAKAKKIITDAVIGLIISILSVAIVNLIAGALK